MTSRPERADLGPRRLPERSPSTRGTVGGDPHGRLDGAAGHRRDAAAAADGQSVLLVGVCSGHRCAALRRLDSANSHATGSSRDGVSDATYPESEELVRQAIRDRRQAVLVSLPCLGPCSEASVTALGAASAGPHSLTWLGRPSLFGLTQTPERARALADWIAADAPNPHSLPTPLRRRI